MFVYEFGLEIIIQLCIYDYLPTLRLNVIKFLTDDFEKILLEFNLDIQKLSTNFNIS